MISRPNFMKIELSKLGSGIPYKLHIYIAIFQQLETNIL